jgi:hypothetical protein
VGVFGSLGLCVNVCNADVNYAVSPASPKATEQDVATVFHAFTSSSKHMPKGVPCQVPSQLDEENIVEYLEPRAELANHQKPRNCFSMHTYIVRIHIVLLLVLRQDMAVPCQHSHLIVISYFFITLDDLYHPFDDLYHPLSTHSFWHDA